MGLPAYFSFFRHLPAMKIKVQKNITDSKYKKYPNLSYLSSDIKNTED